MMKKGDDEEYVWELIKLPQVHATVIQGTEESGPQTSFKGTVSSQICSI
jgi:hypothetical protein